MTGRDSSARAGFPDEPNVAVFTTVRVLDGALIRDVHHHSEDGAWEFLDRGPLTPDDMRVVALASVIELDPSLAEIGDLPFGWSASRDAIGGEWTREEELATR